MSPSNVSAKVYLRSNKLLSASKARLSELSLIQFIPLQTLRKRRTKWKKINNRGDTVEQAYGVNFTSPLDQSSNVPAQRVWHNQFHQQICAQLYQYTEFEVPPNYCSLGSKPFTSKISENLQCPKICS